VRDAAKRLVDLGAQVTEVAIPMHLSGQGLWTSIGAEGLTQTMGTGYGLSRQDFYSVP
jgi:amidase